MGIDESLRAEDILMRRNCGEEFELIKAMFLFEGADFLQFV